MNINFKELKKLVERFRLAVENADFSKKNVDEEVYLIMKDFPERTCIHITTILGIYLKNVVGISPLKHQFAEIELENSYGFTHHWLEYDGIIIDITADQYPVVQESIIFSRKSEFHGKYVRKAHTRKNRFNYEGEPYYTQNIYDTIIVELEKTK